MSYKLILILSLWLPCMGAYAELESCTEFPKSEADIKAFQVQKQVAESGEVSAINKLAEMYLYGRGVEHDTHKAVELYRKVAERGDISAYVGLGEIYRYGYKGVKQDVHEAVKWHFKAATRGHIPSQKTLEKIYKEGLIFADEKAYFLSKTMIEQNLKYLSNYYPSMTADQVKALKQSFMFPEFKQIAQLFQQQANQGEAWAQSILGQLYEYGWGVKQDYSVALKWWTKAAEQGNASAQARLADIYTYYRHIYDITRYNTSSISRKWWTKAAQQGHVESQFVIAFIYRYHENPYEAIYWYKKYAAESDIILHMLGDLYYEGRVEGARGLSVKKGYQKAVKWYHKMLNLNGYIEWAYMPYRLGLMYEKGGVGVKQDYQQAYIWFTKTLKSDKHYAYEYKLYSKIAKQGITRVLEHLTVEEIEAADKEVNLTHLKEAKTVHCGINEFREFFITYAYNKDIRRQYTQCPIQYSNIEDVARVIDSRMVEYAEYGLSEFAKNTAYNQFVHHKEDYMYHSNVRIKQVNEVDGQAVVIYNAGKNGTYNYTFKHDKCWALIKEDYVPYE